MHLAQKWKGHILNIKNKKQNKITRSPFFIVSDLQQRQIQESNRIAKHKKKRENGLSITCVTTTGTGDSLTPPWHASDKPADGFLRNDPPFFQHASCNSWSVWGWCCQLWRRLPIKSQRCSIQFRSGLRGGQWPEFPSLRGSVWWPLKYVP